MTPKKKRERICPVCQENHVAAKDSGYHPFCSERCKLVDLSKWLGGEYVVSKPIFDIDDHS